MPGETKTSEHGADSHTDLILRLESLQSELDVMRGELSGAERLASLGTLAAMVAHEVNNLMTPIICYAQLSQAHPNDSELAAKAVERALHSAQQASKAATAILSLARNSDGGGQQTCDIRETVGHAIACVPRGTLRGVEVVNDAAENLFARIAPVALLQVVLNLVLNAVRAVGGTGTVKVMTRLNGARIELTVQDSGPGVPTDIAPMLFQPFRAKSTQGNGLGLAICRRLLTEVGGDIHLLKAGGPGATFVVRLNAAGHAAIAA